MNVKNYWKGNLMSVEDCRFSQLGRLWLKSYEPLRRFDLKKITDVSEDPNAGTLYPDDEGTTVFRKDGNSLSVDMV